MSQIHRNKTVRSIRKHACNVTRITFTDNSFVEFTADVTGQIPFIRQKSGKHKVKVKAPPLTIRDVKIGKIYNINYYNSSYVVKVYEIDVENNKVFGYFITEYEMKNGIDDHRPHGLFRAGATRSFEIVSIADKSFEKYFSNV